ncbi:hypothetical protein QT322_08235 [Escherichia coli]|nr:hypothetical protein [Escherichia coli]
MSFIITSINAILSENMECSAILWKVMVINASRSLLYGQKRRVCSSRFNRAAEAPAGSKAEQVITPHI